MANVGYCRCGAVLTDAELIRIKVGHTARICNECRNEARSVLAKQLMPYSLKFNPRGDGLPVNPEDALTEIERNRADAAEWMV